MASSMTWVARGAVLMAAAAVAISAGRGPAPVRAAEPEPPPLDASQFDPSCGIEATVTEATIRLDWSTPAGSARLVVRRGPGPLIERLELRAAAAAADMPPLTLARDVEPRVWVTLGSREPPRGRPPEMSPFNVFFDNPWKRPHARHASRFVPGRAALRSAGRRATLALEGLEAGSFCGRWELTLYADAPLVHVEAVLSTAEQGRAFVYDAGLVGSSPGWREFAWRDTAGAARQQAASDAPPARPLEVRHRAVMAAADGGGTLACFPPPHQFQFPRDYTDNLGFCWAGRLTDEPGEPLGFGVRQPPTGGGNFVPWCNAPPGTWQRLGAFYLLSAGRPAAALDEVLRHTRGDRFAPLPGHITFTSHYHMAIAVAALDRQLRGQSESTVPAWVGVFRDLGVQALHLGEFHGDGHPKDPGSVRLRELEAMFAECRRLSDERLLVIPGEELNEYLGIEEPGKHPGHWMTLFPRPVYFTMRRAEGDPFVADVPPHGKVYRVTSRAEMLELLRREGGLAWTAHPRIKASSWTPDIFRHEDFFLDRLWLGAAWKAMPTDLSDERLGRRALDLLDDMSNWGARKYLPGEVDVFRIDPTHELYGHMNINYVRLDRLPRFDEGWQPLCDALGAGRFFVTTGEVLLREFHVGGRASGETLALPADARPELIAELDWTFPLRFAEVISGDGARVYRERIDLSDTGPFGQRRLALRPALEGRRWVRFEVWDVAANGAFSQPVWLEPGP